VSGCCNMPEQVSLSISATRLTNLHSKPSASASRGLCDAGLDRGRFMAAHRHSDAMSAGCVGLPPPGCHPETHANGTANWKLRVQSPSVTPGYWRRGRSPLPMHSTEDGFLRTGDALAWRKPEISKPAFVTTDASRRTLNWPPARWVRVGSLRTHLLKHLTARGARRGDRRGKPRLHCRLRYSV